MGVHTILPFGIFCAALLLILVKSDDYLNSTQIYLDCGLQGDRYELDSDQGHGQRYVTDDEYIGTGEKRNISSNYLSDNSIRTTRRFQTVRSFSDYDRSCYNLNPATKAGDQYFIQTSFMYGNYDNLNKIPSFDLYIGADFWFTVVLGNATDVLLNETIVQAQQDSLYVCLVNTGFGTPFISVLSLRQTETKQHSNFTSVDNTKSLTTYRRINLGTIEDLRQLPDDVFNRYWTADNDSYGLPFNTSKAVNWGDTYTLPSSVMESQEFGRSLSVGWQTSSSGSDERFLLCLHFAEINDSFESGSRRSIDVACTFGTNSWNGSISPEYLKSTTIFTPIVTSTTGSYQCTISPHSTNSSYDAILNAYEIFKYYSVSGKATSDEDVNAINQIKKHYQIKKNWVGDPCLPKSWAGLRCDTTTNPQKPTITALNLSSSNYHGDVSGSFALLKSLRTLDLSGNNISCSSIPRNLQTRVNDKSLKLRLDNGVFCSSNSTNKRTTIITVVAVVVSILALVVIFVVWRRRKAKKATSAPHPEEELTSIWYRKGQVFSYEDVTRITSEFSSIISRRGSCIVYLGKLESGEEVAVKRFPKPTPYVAREFTTQADLLMTFHHKHLVSLIGYCEEGEEDLILIYEHMPGGNLRELLSGKIEKMLASDWKLRLDISLAIAKGLEYLHFACKPPFIHLDVNSSNILFDGKFVAKLADVGLMKLRHVENTDFSTTTGKTAYVSIDPEYSKTKKLTEKTDVYAFGVVLFEILTGHPTLIEEYGHTVHVIRWATPKISSGKVSSWSDSNLQLQEDGYLESIQRVAKVAISCTAEVSKARPNMTEVIRELKVAADFCRETVQTQYS